MDFADTEDVELALALALSMQEEEARQARVASAEIAFRRLQSPRKLNPKATKGSEKEPTSRLTPAEPLIGVGPLSLLANRAEMEHERLARQKRLRPSSPPPWEQPCSSREDVDSGATRDSSRKRAKLDPSAEETQGRVFFEGTLFRITTQYATKVTEPGISLSEILGPKEQLSQAILCAYVVDPVWLYGFFDPRTPVVLVTDARMCGANHDVDERGSGPLLRRILPNWVRVSPRGHRIGDFGGCMHMKYMLLFSKSGTLRVVVSSANLVDHDWRDIENYAYVQDFPKASLGTENTITRQPGEKAGETFPEVLAGVLRATGVDEALNVLRRDGHACLPLPSVSASFPNLDVSVLECGWDWRAAHSGRVGLVPSVSGRWEGWAGENAASRYGQTRLMRSVILLGASLEDGNQSRTSSCSSNEKTVNNFVKHPSNEPHQTELTLNCLGSSLGTYTAPWIAGFRLCAAGQTKALHRWLDGGRKKTFQQGPTNIIYPTVQSINATTLGRSGAGTIFCRPTAWKALRDLGAVGGTGVSGLRMLDARSKNGEAVAMHTKMILGTLPVNVSASVVFKEKPISPTGTSDTPRDECETTQRPPYAWLYVGSHNFTEAAWGRMSGKGSNPVLTTNNYELGVVLRLETPADVDKSVAWTRPARPYTQEDDPWIQGNTPTTME